MQRFAVGSGGGWCGVRHRGERIGRLHADDVERLDPVVLRAVVAPAKPYLRLDANAGRERPVEHVGVGDAEPEQSGDLAIGSTARRKPDVMPEVPPNVLAFGYFKCELVSRRAGAGGGEFATEDAGGVFAAGSGTSSRTPERCSTLS